MRVLPKRDADARLEVVPHVLAALVVPQDERVIAVSVDHVRACASKKRYATDGIAFGAAARRWYESGVLLRVYRCDDGCGGWHLTKRAVEFPRPGWRQPEIGVREMAALRRRQRLGPRPRRSRRPRRRG